jgi:hypothetical protein
MRYGYRVIMYERTTDRVGGIIDVPTALVAQALSIAGISKTAELGETELTDAEVRALANLLGFRSDVSRYHYHLETLATDPLRA